MGEPGFTMSQTAFKDPCELGPFEWLQINPMHTIMHCNCTGTGVDRSDEDGFEWVQRR